MTELPLLILAFLMISLLLGPMLWELSDAQLGMYHAFSFLIWAIFSIHLILKVLVSTKRWAYIKIHWKEALTILVPLLRPLRLIRIIIMGSRAWVGTRRLVHIDFILGYAIGLVMVAATLAVTFERGFVGPLQTFSNGIWWAIATITTIGYGDIVSVTSSGKNIVFVLMLGGIALFGGLTANPASILMNGSTPRNKSIRGLPPGSRLCGRISQAYAHLIGRTPLRNHSHRKDQRSWT